MPVSLSKIETATTAPFQVQVRTVDIGGGARSPLWCQIHADVLGRTIHQVDEPVLANARGAAFQAAVQDVTLEVKQSQRAVSSNFARLALRQQAPPLLEEEPEPDGWM